jgi:hypothetical protein
MQNTLLYAVVTASAPIRCGDAILNEWRGARILFADKLDKYYTNFFSSAALATTWNGRLIMGSRGGAVN